MTFPEGLNATSSQSSTAPASAVVQLGRLEYVVNFSSTGDTYDVPFGISMNDQIQKPPNPTLFLERNGSYSWTIVSVDGTNTPSINDHKTVAAGFDISPASGQIVVAGNSVNEVINFHLILYSITFVESGLPSGTPWSISMNLTSPSSTTDTIVFNLPNYSEYFFIIHAPVGYTATPSSGNISLEGVNQTIDDPPLQQLRIILTTSNISSGSDVARATSARGC